METTLNSTANQRLCNFCLGFAAFMYFISLFFLSTAGETVGYFLLISAVALYPLVSGERRLTRILALGLVILGGLSANIDHSQAMNRYWFTFHELVKLRSQLATQPTTSP